MNEHEKEREGPPQDHNSNPIQSTEEVLDSIRKIIGSSEDEITSADATESELLLTDIPTEEEIKRYKAKKRKRKDKPIDSGVPLEDEHVILDKDLTQNNTTQDSSNATDTDDDSIKTKIVEIDVLATLQKNSSTDTHNSFDHVDEDHLGQDHTEQNPNNIFLPPKHDETVETPLKKEHDSESMTKETNPAQKETEAHTAPKETQEQEHTPASHAEVKSAQKETEAHTAPKEEQEHTPASHPEVKSPQKETEAHTAPKETQEHTPASHAEVKSAQKETEAHTAPKETQEQEHTPASHAEVKSAQKETEAHTAPKETQEQEHTPASHPEVKSPQKEIETHETLTEVELPQNAPESEPEHDTSEETISSLLNSQAKEQDLTIDEIQNLMLHSLEPEALELQEHKKSDMQNQEKKKDVESELQASDTLQKKSDQETLNHTITHLDPSTEELLGHTLQEFSFDDMRPQPSKVADRDNALESSGSQSREVAPEPSVISPMNSIPIVKSMAHITQSMEKKYISNDLLLKSIKDILERIEKYNFSRHDLEHYLTRKQIDIFHHLNLLKKNKIQFKNIEILESMLQEDDMSLSFSEMLKKKDKKENKEEVADFAKEEVADFSIDSILNDMQMVYDYNENTTQKRDDRTEKITEDVFENNKESTTYAEDRPMNQMTKQNDKPIPTEQSISSELDDMFFLPKEALEDDSKESLQSNLDDLDIFFEGLETHGQNSPQKEKRAQENIDNTLGFEGKEEDTSLEEDDQALEENFEEDNTMPEDDQNDDLEEDFEEDESLDDDDDTTLEEDQDDDPEEDFEEDESLDDDDDTTLEEDQDEDPDEDFEEDESLDDDDDTTLEEDQDEDLEEDFEEDESLEDDDNTMLEEDQDEDLEEDFEEDESLEDDDDTMLEEDQGEDPEEDFEEDESLEDDDDTTLEEDQDEDLEEDFEEDESLEDDDTTLEEDQDEDLEEDFEEDESLEDDDTMLEEDQDDDPEDDFEEDESLEDDDDTTLEEDQDEDLEEDFEEDESLEDDDTTLEEDQDDDPEEDFEEDESLEDDDDTTLEEDQDDDPEEDFEEDESLEDDDNTPEEDQDEDLEEDFEEDESLEDDDTTLKEDHSKDPDENKMSIDKMSLKNQNPNKIEDVLDSLSISEEHTTKQFLDSVKDIDLLFLKLKHNLSPEEVDHLYEKSINSTVLPATTSRFKQEKKLTKDALHKMLEGIASHPLPKSKNRSHVVSVTEIPRVTETDQLVLKKKNKPKPSSIPATFAKPEQPNIPTLLEHNHLPQSPSPHTAENTVEHNHLPQPPSLHTAENTVEHNHLPQPPSLHTAENTVEHNHLPQPPSLHTAENTVEHNHLPQSPSPHTAENTVEHNHLPQSPSPHTAENTVEHNHLPQSPSPHTAENTVEHNPTPYQATPSDHGANQQSHSDETKEIQNLNVDEKKEMLQKSTMSSVTEQEDHHDPLIESRSSLSSPIKNSSGEHVMNAQSPHNDYQKETASLFNELKQVCEVQKTTARHDASPQLKDLVLEGIIREAINPLLKDWITENLPQITEKIIREEIKKIISPQNTQ